MRYDDDYREALHRLSVVDDSDWAMSRRQILKAALAAGGASVALGAGVGLGGGAADATTVGGNLLLIQLAGGNDGFDMLPPTKGKLAQLYQAYRGEIAITNAIPARISGGMASGFGFNPAMPYVASRYKAGRVAVVRGVGYPNASLSHFEAIGVWMVGSGATGPATAGGWIGRWLDTFVKPGLVDAVQIGSSVPLHMQGTTRKASSIDVWEPDFGTSTDDSEQLMYNAIRGYAAQTNARGPLADRFAGATKSMMSINQSVKPLYTTPTALPGEDIVAKLTLAARIFNAGLGVRVISTIQGDYDHHSGEPAKHAETLKALDDGLRAFFTSLKPAMRNRTTVMTFSEFGRKAHSNDSQGTDHGRASHLLVMGEKVRGGMVGNHPKLDGLDTWDDAEPTVDFRSVYSAVVKNWLKGNPATVVGGSFPKLSLFRSGPS
jgi:uncharacterized protein (DUF1501 family)